VKDFWKAFLGVLLISMDVSIAQAPELNPSPQLSPEEVVRFQITALQHNDDPHSDAGIERTFRFASPSNKSVTGPLEHFVRIVKSAAYLPMINSQDSAVIGSRINGEKARVVVRITPEKGPQQMYLFLLTKQQTGEFADCWMTDGVVPVQAGESPPDEPITI
jgi:hypothetical protein